jgi:multiple antibiotic resistance protein
MLGELNDMVLPSTLVPNVLGDLSTLPLAFAALMPIVNPFGTALLVLALVGPQPPDVYRQLASKVAWIMMGFVLAVELIGQWLLHFFGISLPILQLGGGLTLAAMGWRTLIGGGHSSSSSGRTADEKEDVLAHAFYPYTFPLTVGPGAIVVLITLSAHATRPTTDATLIAHLGILLGAMLQAMLVYVCYRFAPLLGEKLSASAINGIQQLMAFILLCIGGQIAWGGVAALLRDIVH